MRLSQSEHNIKKNLAEREIQPSNALWEKIQQDLDQEQSKPKTIKLWWRVGSVAAIFILAFLAYQGLKPSQNINTNIVLETKPIQTKPVIIEADKLELVFSQTTPTLEVEPTKTTTPKTEKTQEIQASQAQDKPTLASEVDMLLAQAQEEIAQQKKEEQLVAEVNNLLAEAIAQTEDLEQKQILKNINATLLLAEVEAEIELEKPPLLKDRIWEAVVSNLNDLKNSLVVN